MAIAEVDEREAADFLLALMRPDLEVDQPDSSPPLIGAMLVARFMRRIARISAIFTGNPKRG